MATKPLKQHITGCPQPALSEAEWSGLSDVGIAQSAAAPAGARTTLNRRAFLATMAAAPYALTQPPTHTPTFTVLSLFRPQHLILHADTAPLTILLNDQPQTLARGESLTLNAADNPTLKILTPTTFSIEVPNKLRRTYTAALRIDNAGNHLRCIVGIERELAVASIVAAESPPHATPHALAAQAIAARSFLVGATTSHADADFCDTTHCQYLREPTPPNSPATQAAQRTAGLVLQYRDAEATPHTLAAMYSRSCGGRTRTLAELGLPARDYPYYAVDCAFCRAHPEVWQRDIDTPLPNTEAARLDYNRIHGWSALPGPIDTATTLRITGRGTGHGLGLCQLGAADLATRGASFTDILTHYYPNTTLARAT